MNKIFLLINPFPESASHGIHNYNLNLLNFLSFNNIKTDYFANNKKLSLEKFREAVYEYVTQNYGTEDVIIEAPEVKASTLLLDNSYNVHIRIHTPGAVAQKYDNAAINYELFGLELEVIQKSKYVSAPSYGILKELHSHLNRKNISVYKNPFNNNIEISSFEDKEYDVIFMARFQTLKGIKYLNPILSKLPENYKVLLLGNNATKFKLDPSINCKVTQIEEISSELRFDYVKKSKVLMQLSNFENCSMVNLESFACGTVVCAWDVGGNSEMADNNILKIIENGNTQAFANAIINMIERNNYPSEREFINAIKDIQDDFEQGFENLIYTPENIYSGLNKNNKPKQEKEIVKINKITHVSHDKEFKKFGERIFGFSLSNEQPEEMWIPIINKFNADYRFVCRRPLGFMYKFNNPFYVDPNKYIRFDWIKYPNLLMEEIEKFKPNKIFFHNGIHPMYKEVLVRLKKRFPLIPIVYSELGWYPQQDNIYFDEWGTNGMSKLANESFEEFCDCDFPEFKQESKINGNHVLVITQLENDTNVIVNSKRFKSMENFVSYVLNELEEENIIIKTHPLDNDKERFEKFNSDRVRVIHEGDLSELIENSKAVIGINSTVLLEALKYETNIYMFGDYLLNNKKVVIECGIDDSIRELWTDKYYSNRIAKDLVIQEFKNRQINIKELANVNISELVTTKAFRPLLSRVHVYSAKEEFNILNLKLNLQNKNCNTKYETFNDEDITLQKRHYTVQEQESITLFKKGLFQQSIDAFYKAIEKEGDLPRLRRKLAEVLYSVGNKGEALKQLELAQKKIPKNKNLKRRILKMKYGKLAFWIKDTPFI